MCEAEETVLRTGQDDINLAADRDPTELGWGNSQRTCLGPEKRLVIKTDVYTVIQKNTFQERERAERSAYKPSAGKGWLGRLPSRSQLHQRSD